MADTLIKMILNNQLMVFLKMERCNNIVWANTGHFLREKLTFGQENINKKQPGKFGIENKEQVQWEDWLPHPWQLRCR